MHKTVYVEQWDNYVKQTYRNRCIIATENGALSLTVPTEKSIAPKVLLKDVRISEHGNWEHLHWNAIKTAYRNSPFFDYYEDDFSPFYQKKFTYLFDFNQQLCELVCNLIDIRSQFLPTTEYLHAVPDGITDVRSWIEPKVVIEESQNFSLSPYYQVFSERNGFLPNISIVDLLFNMGPESLIVLRDSIH